MSRPQEADPLDSLGRVPFAHHSERRFAELLDFYGIDWHYEPRTFVLSEGPDGQPLEAFTPDFHLPAFDLYIELTTLRQQLVTRKNRKVRLLEQRHPDVRVKILYKRDYAALVARFGMEDAPARPGS
jgi:hypoxanthine phosphoribosyltransferase